MSMNPLGSFFYRSSRREFNFCAHLPILPIVNRIGPIAKNVIELARPYARSLVGRIAASAVAETACSTVGSIIGERVVCSICVAMGPQVLLAATLGTAIYAISRKKNPLLAISVLAFGMQTPLFSKEWRVSRFLYCGQWAGRMVGTIVGGYLGLKLINTQIPLVDRTNLANSYAVNMGKYLAAGLAFDLVEVSASIPYLNPVVKTIFSITKSISQAIAYNSQIALPFFRKCLREKKIVPTAPLALKMICNRYCIENSFRMSSQLTQVVSETILPSIIRQNFVAPSIRQSIEFLGNNSDMFARILMRSFTQYCKLLKRIQYEAPDISMSEDEDLVTISNEDDSKRNVNHTQKQVRLGIDPVLLKKCLKTKIAGAQILSPILGAALKQNFMEWSDLLIEIIRETEKDLIGTQLLDEDQAVRIKEILPIYLKYYLIYVLAHCQKFKQELTLIEEREFFETVNEAFFSIYTHSSSPHRWAQCLRKISECVIEKLYSLRRFFEQGDQETLVVSPITVIEEYS